MLWSFFGVRRRSDAARDLQSASFGMVVAAGIFVAAALVVSIAALVRFVVVEAPRGPSDPAAGQAQAAAQVKRHGPVKVHGTMEERVPACTACHSDATQATPDGFSPRIAGKPAGYLFNQLVSFRDGVRTYPPMVYLTQNLSEAYLREMAEHFSALELPYPVPERMALSSEQAARAQRIVEQGDAARGVPACVECHGRTLAGWRRTFRAFSVCRAST